MGVRRLQTFLEQHCPQACYEISIEELANDYRCTYQRDPVIVVDGSSCFRKLYTGLDWVCGGQYKEYVDIITKFIDGFERLSIKLIFFFDGATQESKRPVWVKRRLQNMDNAHAIIDALKGGCEVQRVKEDLSVLPAGAGSVMSFIASTRCKVLRSIKECDDEIASYAEENECFAILAQDSDFVIYRHGARYYLSSGNLDIDRMTTLVYDKVALARYLNFSMNDLPIFASLMGNDHISADDLKPFHCWLTGRQRHHSYIRVLVERVARFVQTFPKQKNLFFYCKQLSHNVFRTAHRAGDLQKSIQSYEKISIHHVRSSCCQNEKWDKILSVAHDNYIEMKSPSYIYNILRKLPFEMSYALEDYRSALPPSAIVLRQMRQRIYGLALREYPGRFEDDFAVEEWCISGPESLNSALKVPIILPPEDSPYLLDLWLNDSSDLKETKFKLLGWIASGHLDTMNLNSCPHEIVSAICILSYLYHDAGVIYDWEVKVFATVVVEVQAMEPKDLSIIRVKKVNVRGVQLATLFSRSITHMNLANSICGDPVNTQLTKHPQLFDGKLFQTLYSNAQVVPVGPKGDVQLYQQICKYVLS